MIISTISYIRRRYSYTKLNTNVVLSRQYRRAYNVVSAVVCCYCIVLPHQILLLHDHINVFMFPLYSAHSFALFPAVLFLPSLVAAKL